MICFPYGSTLACESIHRLRSSSRLQDDSDDPVSPLRVDFSFLVLRFARGQALNFNSSRRYRESVAFVTRKLNEKSLKLIRMKHALSSEKRYSCLNFSGGNQW